MSTGSDAGNSGWVSDDDWYTRIEVAWDSNDYGCTYTATLKVYSRYWTNRNSGVKYDINFWGNHVTGTVGSPGITPGNWATIATASKYVSRTHSSTTWAISGWVGAASGSGNYANGATASWPASSHALGALASHTYHLMSASGTQWSTVTKWFSEQLTLPSSTPSKTGYTFKGWSTTNGGTVSYSAGGSYWTSDVETYLYAVWEPYTYTVAYNANGGTGAPSAQTKTYGTNLTLSSTKPTRNLYNFKGWATSSTGSVAYAAGGTYSANAAVTLYAVWEVAWVAPRITNVNCYRSDSSGNASDTGTYITAKFNWATDNNVSSIKVAMGGTTYTASGSGKSDSVTLTKGTYSSENSYNVVITVADTTGSSSSTQTVAATHYIMDFSNVGAVGINTTANRTSKRLDINLPTYWSDPYQARTALGLEDGYMSRRYYIRSCTGTSGLILWLGTWSSSGDSDSIVLDVYSGDGYNGQARQNTHIRIYVKNAWQSTKGTSAAFGATACLDGVGSNDGFELYVYATAHDSCNIYMKMPWSYYNGCYIVQQCWGTWTHKDTVVTSFTGTAQATSWYFGGFYAGRCLQNYENWLALKAPVKLWSGTASAGSSITISNLNDYYVLGVTTDPYYEPLLMFNYRDGQWLSAGCSIDDGSNTYDHCVSFKKNAYDGTTLTYRQGSYHMWYGSTSGNLTLKAIYGII